MHDTIAGDHPGPDTQPAWFEVDGRPGAVQRLRNRNRGRGWAIAVGAALALWVVIGLAIWAAASLLG